MRFLDSLGYVLLGWIGHHAAGAHGSASRGGVASESKLCSQIGAELIERGPSTGCSREIREMRQMQWLGLLFALAL
ncbi:hypothetical protein CJF32_00007113 [Rutstroemia sp. NJR-2017a WRK4]|nr:hypothetical protein CJF32_00007113 [Rutstroemia sp. NJR-2017a WRK4]